MKPITAVVKEKGGAVTYPVNQEVTINADGSGGPVSIAKQVRKAKNPATKPKNKVTESYDEKRRKRIGSGNYLPKTKEPLQNRGPQQNAAKERQRQRAIQRQETENRRRGSSPLQKKDACYSKVKSRYKKWPSAYASGALVKCRKVGAANWGNKSKK